MKAIGRYQIVDAIGEGAMATVYRAHDPNIGRDIAIKVLKSELRRDDEIRSRFLREARTAGALSHPGIATIHDVGEADHVPYIAMELLIGEPLSDHLASRGKLAIEDAIAIGQQLARALNYAHSLGVVHRDVKPSNIILCDDGTVAKIVDFGIARSSEADRMRAELAAISTQVGQVLGTPRYMSPEQALGTDVDHRSDLFSLGAVLYEMVVGKPAFDGTSFASITVQVVRDQPVAPAKRAVDCPPGIQSIIDRLLAKDPAKRFASGNEVADALAREEKRLGRKARTFPRLSFELRRTLAIAFAGALIAAGPAKLVINQQQQWLEQTANKSGDSVASFVAANTALLAADNYSLPEAQQDWLPVEAFVRNAAKEPGIQEITIVDAHGRSRASSRRTHSGTSAGEPSDSSGTNAFIRRDIVYAGHKVGEVEVTLDRAGLDALQAKSRNLVIELGALMLLIFSLATFLALRSVMGAVRRATLDLGTSLEGGSPKLCHDRTDELGTLFEKVYEAFERRSAAGSTSVSATSNRLTRVTAVQELDSAKTRIRA